jgi:colicin import membrane protein
MTTAAPTFNQKQIAGDRSEDHLRKFIWFSVAAHVVAFLIFGVRAYFAPDHNINMENVVRVDLVGLPDKAKPQPIAPAPAVTPPAPETKQKIPPKLEKPEPAKINLNKTKKDEMAALKRLEAIERLKSSMAPKEQKAEPQTQASAPVRGNQLSRGSALTGIAKMDYENYQDTALAHIRKFWNLPHWMTTANLDARVRVWLDAQGNIVRKEMTQKSARSEFDDRVMSALTAANPLPRPPDELATVLSVEGIEIEFIP